MYIYACAYVDVGVRIWDMLCNKQVSKQAACFISTHGEINMYISVCAYICILLCVYVKQFDIICRSIWADIMYIQFDSLFTSYVAKWKQNKGEKTHMYSFGIYIANEVDKRMYTHTHTYTPTCVYNRL